MYIVNVCVYVCVYVWMHGYLSVCMCVTHSESFDIVSRVPHEQFPVKEPSIPGKEPYIFRQRAVDSRKEALCSSDSLTVRICIHVCVYVCTEYVCNHVYMFICCYVMGMCMQDMLACERHSCEGRVSASLREIVGLFSLCVQHRALLREYRVLLALAWHS